MRARSTGCCTELVPGRTELGGRRSLVWCQMAGDRRRMGAGAARRGRRAGGAPGEGRTAAGSRAEPAGELLLYPAPGAGSSVS